MKSENERCGRAVELERALSKINGHKPNSQQNLPTKAAATQNMPVRLDLDQIFPNTMEKSRFPCEVHLGVWTSPWRFAYNRDLLLIHIP